MRGTGYRSCNVNRQQFNHTESGNNKENHYKENGRSWGDNSSHGDSTSTSSWSMTKTANNLQDLDSWDPMMADHRNSKGNNATLYIKGVPYNMSKEGLMELFSTQVPEHKILSCNVRNSQHDHLGTKVAFISYSNLDECENVIKMMDRFKLGNSSFSVNLKKDKNQNRSQDEGPGGRFKFSSSHHHESSSAGGDGGARSRAKVGNESRDNNNNNPWGNHTWSHDNNSNNNSWSNHHTSGNVSAAAKTTSSPTTISTNKASDSTRTTSTTVYKCETCGGNATDLCSICKSVTYCSRDCQTLDWEAHKKMCNPPTENSTTTLSRSDPSEYSFRNSSRARYLEGSSPLEFYVQLIKSSNEIKDKLNHCYATKHSDPDFNPEVDMLVAAFNGNNWIRGKMLSYGSSNNKKARVLNIDTERTEVVDFSALRRLEVGVADIPAQAVKCRLHNANVPDEHRQRVIDFFINTMKESGDNLCVTPVKQNIDDVYEVTVTLSSGADLLDTLCSFNYAQRQASYSDSKQQRLNYPRVNFHQEYNMSVSYVKDCNMFFVSMNTGALEGITKRLYSAIKDTTPGGDLEWRDLIAVVYHHGAKDIPCRAQVLEKVAPTRYKVKFLDYGNIECVDHMDCFKIDSHHFDEEVQALQCRLDIVIPFTKQNDVTTYLRTTLPDDKVVVVEFLKREKSCYVVKLRETNGDSINDAVGRVIDGTEPKVIPRFSSLTNFSRSASSHRSGTSGTQRPFMYNPNYTALELNKKHKMSVSWIDDDRQIFVNVESSIQEEANAPGGYLAQYSADGGSSIATLGMQVELGQLVLSLDESYGEWYRGVIKNINGNRCSVYALDFGATNTVPLTNVFPASDMHAKCPPLAFKLNFDSDYRIKRTFLRLGEEFDEDEVMKMLNAIFVTENKTIEAIVKNQKNNEIEVDIVSFDVMDSLRAKIKPLVTKAGRSPRDYAEILSPTGSQSRGHGMDNKPCYRGKETGNRNSSRTPEPVGDGPAAAALRLNGDVEPSRELLDRILRNQDVILRNQNNIIAALKRADIWSG